MPGVPRGIITVLNTPFAATGAVDLPALQRHVQCAVEAGVSGFLVPAMASEVRLLTPEEKRAVVKTVVDHSSDRAIVIGGASSATQGERLQRATEFLELGCDGILVQLDAGGNAEFMERDLQQLAALNPDILMVQDWDSIGSGIPVPTILRLFKSVERFNWLKIEVANAGPKYTEVLEATAGRLNVAGGWAVTQMIDGLDRGVHAFMPTGMHRIYVEIHRRYISGHRDGAIELFQLIQPVLAFSNQSLDISIRFFKRLLHAQGIYATPDVRIDGPDFDDQQVQTADDLIAIVIDLENQLRRQ